MYGRSRDPCEHYSDPALYLQVDSYLPELIASNNIRRVKVAFLSSGLMPLLCPQRSSFANGSFTFILFSSQIVKPNPIQRTLRV